VKNPIEPDAQRACKHLEGLKAGNSMQVALLHGATMGVTEQCAQYLFALFAAVMFWPVAGTCAR
jgi:hypothetical protein